MLIKASAVMLVYLRLIDFRLESLGKPFCSIVCQLIFLHLFRFRLCIWGLFSRIMSRAVVVMPVSSRLIDFRFESLGKLPSSIVFQLMFSQYRRLRSCI